MFSKMLSLDLKQCLDLQEHFEQVVCDTLTLLFGLSEGKVLYKYQLQTTLLGVSLFLIYFFVVKVFPFFSICSKQFIWGVGCRLWHMLWINDSWSCPFVIVWISSNLHSDAPKSFTAQLAVFVLLGDGLVLFAKTPLCLLTRFGWCLDRASLASDSSCRSFFKHATKTYSFRTLCQTVLLFWHFLEALFCSEIKTFHWENALLRKLSGISSFNGVLLFGSQCVSKQIPLTLWFPFCGRQSCSIKRGGLQLLLSVWVDYSQAEWLCRAAAWIFILAV